MGLVARKEEQKLLNQALCKQESQLIAVYGRRGVGKTYLIREMFSGMEITPLCDYLRGNLVTPLSTQS